MPSPRTLLAGILIGALAGLAANALAAGAPWLVFLVRKVADPIGAIFLNLLLMTVVPVIFSALAIGIAELDLRQLGRVGARTLGYTVVVSAIAVAIGLVLVNVLTPGEGLSPALRERARTSAYTPPPAGSQPTGMAFFVNMFPRNAVKAAADGDMIGLLVFSILFGLALALTPTEEARKLRDLVKGLYDVSMTIIAGVLRLAPIGVGALLFAKTAELGLDIVRQLAAYVAVVLLALGLHMFVVYSISLRLFSGVSPVRFFRSVRLVIVTAFSTASSNATLPTSLKVAEEELRLPTQIARFVLTAGSTMNQNGTALFEGVTTLFLAQLFGIPLDLGQQAMIMGICILGGVGTAGVPGGSLPVVAMILGTFGIPVEGLGLILGVDRFLDMCRTTLNVTGDLAAAVYVARAEGWEPGPDLKA